MTYSTFRNFMDAQPSQERDDTCDDIRYYDSITFTGTKADAEWIAAHYPHLCFDKLRTDDARVIGILSRKNGQVEMQGAFYGD